MEVSLIGAPAKTLSPDQICEVKNIITNSLEPVIFIQRCVPPESAGLFEQYQSSSDLYGWPYGALCGFCRKSMRVKSGFYREICDNQYLVELVRIENELAKTLRKLFCSSPAETCEYLDVDIYKAKTLNYIIVINKYVIVRRGGVVTREHIPCLTLRTKVQPPSLYVMTVQSIGDRLVNSIVRNTQLNVNFSLRYFHSPLWLNAKSYSTVEEYVNKLNLPDLYRKHIIDYIHFSKSKCSDLEMAAAVPIIYWDER